MNTSNPGNQSIGKFGWNSTRNAIIFALFPPATDQIISFIKFCKQHWNIRWVILQISIKQDNSLAMRKIDPSRNCSSLPEVATKRYNAYMFWIFFNKGFQNIKTIVPTPIIHKDNFPYTFNGLQRLLNAIIKNRQIFRLVKHRNDQGQIM